MELDHLAQYINQTLYKLQYPTDCNKRKIILDIDCGFGCTFHHIIFCLYMSTFSNRTLIFENNGDKWKYKVRWSDVFRQITNCSYEKHVKAYLPITQYKGPTQQQRIVLLSLRSATRDLTHLPNVAPSEFEEILIKHHTNPQAWFMGQYANFVLRFNESALLKINKIESKFHMDYGTIAGIHVRRTDKYIEVPPYKLEEYMKWIDLWYNAEEYNVQTINSKLNLKQQNKTLNKRKLFIATDEPKKIILEAEKRWGSQYEFVHNSQDAHYGKVANDPERCSLESLISLIVEIRCLAKCRYVVCTFSSNVCRIVYELMQAYQGYAGENVHSLDFDYEELWNEKQMISISDYKATNNDEIDALKGDIIIFKKQKLNGYVGAFNTRTKKEGKFPHGLLREKLKFESFPVFSFN
uniref:GT23 domain-containing protein n=1 Tax=Meloidogyne incognita TaxID=6306 RepID=A0A914LMB0_MELIC